MAARKIVKEHDGYYALVDGRFFGAYRSRAEALAGYEVERRRAADRLNAADDAAGNRRLDRPEGT